MSEPRALTAQAVEALQIHDPRTYSWFGARHGLDPVQVSGWPETELWRSLALVVQQRLYLDFYTQGVPVPSVDRRLAPARRGRTDLRAALSAANRSSGTRDAGWCVLDVRGRTLLVERGGLTISVPRDLFDAGGHLAVATGVAGSVLLPADLPHRSPGYFVVLGDRPPSPAENPVRVYLNLVGHRAPEALGALTDALGRLEVPFELKVLDDSSAYRRCDAGVLYVRRSDLGTTLPLCHEVLHRLPGALKPRVPAFTAATAPGIGWAESPADGESFGMHRCGLVATAVVACRRDGADDPLRYVERGFAEAGVDLDAPHRAARPVVAAVA